MCYTKLEDHWFDYSALQQTIEISTICPTNWHCIDRKIGLQLQIESKLKCMVPPHTLKFKQFAFINFISSNKQILPTNFSGFLSKGHSQFVDVPLMYYTIKAIWGWYQEFQSSKTKSNRMLFQREGFASIATKLTLFQLGCVT